MVPRKMLFSALVLVLFAFAATTLRAQLNRGIIEGIVTDPQGAVVPAADVIITAIDTNVSSATKTNNTGYFRVVDLVPGKYKARFTAPGFNAVEILDIEVPAGQVIKVDAQLKLGSTTETVQVEAEAALLLDPTARLNADDLYGSAAPL